MVRLSRELARSFVLRFALAAALMLSIYYFPYEGRATRALVGAYLALYARLAGAAVSLFDGSVHVTGTHITGRMAMDFALSCDAMDVYILFAAAILAFPAGWRRRAAALLVAFGALVLLNILRIVSLYFIGVHFPSKFEMFHMQVWPLVLVVLASGSFLAWARLSITTKDSHAMGLPRQA
jgi:exosortase/archaeosortase family protein